MKKVLCSLCTLATLAFLLALPGFAAEKGTWSGTVSDANCATKGAMASDSACVKKCLENGAKAVLVTDNKDVLTIQNPEAIKGHEGHTVKITGTLDNNELHVDKLEMAKK